jgi:RNA polymerase sigma-70 factor (ECF subfamily)
MDLAAHTLETYLLDHRSRLLAFIQGKVSDPDLAEDILQESLLKALRAAPALRERDKLVSWFYQIIRHAITDAYRRGRRAATHRKQYAEAMQTQNRYLNPVDPEDEAVLCACFQALLPTLKPEYAALIERIELGDEDPAAAAERLDITRNNLKVRRHRARQQLKQRLEETCRTCAEHGCLDCTCRRQP